MKAYLIDVRNDQHGPVETDGSLESLYALIGCDCIDIVVREVHGHPLNVVCDDEGLLVDSPTVSAMTFGMRPELFGNLVLFGIGDDRDLCSLTDEEVEKVGMSVAERIDIDRGTAQPVLFVDKY